MHWQSGKISKFWSNPEAKLINQLNFVIFSISWRYMEPLFRRADSGPLLLTGYNTINPKLHLSCHAFDQSVRNPRSSLSHWCSSFHSTTFFAQEDGKIPKFFLKFHWNSQVKNVNFVLSKQLVFLAPERIWN